MNNNKVYIAGLKFMLVNAVKRLYNGEVFFKHSLDKGIHATIEAETKITKTELKKIKSYMKKMVKDNIPFNRKVVSKQEAYDFFVKKGHLEKADNILTVQNLTVTLYEFEGQYNYFYSEMPESTGELDLFDLYYVTENELVLVYPTNGEIVFEFRKKIYNLFKDTDDWNKKIGIDYVMDVNEMMAQGKIADVIRKQNIMVNQNLYDIARDIHDKKKKIILIAGPSCSGKTTTSKKMSLYLSSLGLNALPISLDDFFVDRGDTPLDENGKPDYECLEALDLKLFNSTLQKLLDGKEVKIPRFNFLTGKKEYDDSRYCIGENDVLVIEGLHAINPKLLKLKDQSMCYKLYISPLTPLSVDRHNYVSTTDNRLLRRIVRDFRTRGRSCEASLATWASVRRGEEKHIFPYTDTCDAMLNTAYVYELGVLKVYVEPLLRNVKMDSEFYYEARRLLDNLQTFFTVPSENVDDENLLREFIGGSRFEE